MLDAYTFLRSIKPGSTVYYQIPGGNGTRPSDVLTVKTAPAPGQDGEFETLIVNDFGYTNAHGTHQYMLEHAQNGAAFAWHGGDISCAFPGPHSMSPLSSFFLPFVLTYVDASIAMQTLTTGAFRGNP